VFSSCANKPQTNLLAFRAIGRSLTISNSFIAKQNELLIEQIENKSKDSVISVSSSNWQTKAELIKKLTTEINEYIDGLKISLKHEAGFTMINDREFFREDDVNAVSTLFETKGKAEELKEKIIKYENDILAINKEINSTFKNTINFVIRLSDLNKDYQKPFTETFFSNPPVVVAMCVLSNFQNNIYMFQNEVLTFCYNKVQSKN
jgi:hypothetical protein